MPTISAYKDAILTSELSLQQLNYLQPVPGVHDDFYFSSGNFAVVFKMEDTRDGSFKALKCFTRDQERRRESLDLISGYLHQVESEYIIPYTYLEDEIWADGADHPVLLMDWIEGETLGEHVSKLCECQDRHGLERLCQQFTRLSLWLLDQPWAHGDLKHDNILVRPDGSLVLVDFDGCFVSGMGGQEAREMGSPSFRHPNRTIKDFDRHLDDFSILVIFLSLRILAAEPVLRQEQQDGENLVLSIGDISNPATSVMLEQFRRHLDSFLKAAIALLDMAVSFPAGQIFGLREVLKKWLDEEMELALQVPQHMVYVRGGTFEMGDVMEDKEAPDETVHTVTLSNFLLAKNELTFDEYDAFCKATGRELPNDSGWGRGKRPVINVDWYDAIEYCNWRSTQEGLKAVYIINKNIKDSNNSNTDDTKKWQVTTSLSANGYRLPTEAEWEYAARQGGQKVRFGNGKDIANPQEINFDASSEYRKSYSIAGEYREKTLPVGSFSPNTLELFDMSGNVWEWCGDWYGPYPSSASSDPQGAIGGSSRVIRGGSCYSNPAFVRVANRVGLTPDFRDDFIGFRLARAIVSPEKQRELETWNKIPKNDLSSLEGYIRDNTQSSFVEEAHRLIAAIKAQDHMVLVKGGTFEMGDVMGDKEYDDETVHTVTLSNFLLAKNELTFDEYDAFCKATGRALPADEGWGRGKRPVINVDWYDAVEYCNWRSGQEGLQAVYSINKNIKDSNNSNTDDTKKWLVNTDRSANGYRLPTEAEWEYAARAGGKKVRFGNGKDIADPKEINFDALSEHEEAYSIAGEYRQKTLPVGSFSSNTLDLFDMSGNVGEWCGDWYGTYPSSASNASSDPQGATGGSDRVIRGGSWYGNPANVRVAYRVGRTLDHRGSNLGFRLARAIVSPEKQKELETWNKIPKNDLSSLEGYIRDNTQSPFVEEAHHLIAAIQKAQDHMVLVKGGTFEMGDVMGDKEAPNETVHTVTLSNFLLAKNELTFDEFDAFCKATDRELPKDHGWGRGKRPVINVDWYDAVEYCNWRSGQEGLQAVYSINKNSKDSNNSSTSDTKKWLVTTSLSANGYRLPTEAEWEYAARQGGQKVRFGNGKDIADPQEINFDASFGYKKPYSIAAEYRQKTLPVGSFSPNTLELFDMSGNVYEWCWDWYGTYPSSASNDPQGATGGSDRVVRGGSWFGHPANVRVAKRGNVTPVYRPSNIGFRLARAIVSPEKLRELETWNKIPKNDLLSLEGYIRDNSQSSFVEEAQHLIAAIQDHMVLVKGGTFQMGEAKESYQVTLSDFLISKYQLTFDEYDAFCKATGHELPDDMGWGRGNRPVINVTWFDAVDYCNWRSQQEGLGEVYQINQQQVDANWQANGYRLPTEAEWEYAARGGQQSQGFEYAGSNKVNEVAWYSKNLCSKTQPIGQKKANELGLYDMSGNVCEMCWDWKAAYPSSATNDPKGPDTGYFLVIRGGSWSCGWEDVRVAYRGLGTPDGRGNSVGFRLARTIISPEKQRELETWNKIPKNDLSSLEGYIRDNTQSSFVEEAQQLIAAIQKAQDHMVLVKGGTFEMGDVMGDKEKDNETVHTVTLSNFLLAKNELTFDEFDAFCKATDRELPADQGWGRGKRPVINVDWYDAIEYCNWRSGQEGLQNFYNINKNRKDPNNSYALDPKKWLVTTSRSANGYRLPTEAEWEYAARAGGKKVRFGNEKDIADPKDINFDASSEHKEHYSIVGEYGQKTLPVGSFSPNTLDLFDMSGNVWEWCGDWYGTYPSSASNDPQGATEGSDRVYRGGSWVDGPAYVRVAGRFGDTPDYSDGLLGFRLARAIVSPEKQRELETWNKISKNDLSSLEGYIRDNTQSSFVEEAHRLIAAIQKAQDHMVLVKGGTFEMGDVMGDKGASNEKVHIVTLSNFLLAKNELTFDEFDAFCKATDRALPSDSGWGRGKRPVINVDWYDAVEYCNWRSGQEGLQAVYRINKNSKDSKNSSYDNKRWLVTTSRSANGYRLPTEAEWEYAARQGGQKVRFGNGKDIANPQEINFNASSEYREAYSIAGEYRQKTLPVGSFSPNSLELFDMSGNVYEWCGDWYGTYLSSASNDPQGATGGSGRVLRGGSWYGNPAGVRVAFRNHVTPDRRYDNIGFRLARAAVAF